MSVGSAFDAFVKSEIHLMYYPSDSRFDELFESSVSDDHRDYAFKAGKEVFDFYRQCGAYHSLIKLFNVGPPKMEYTLEREIEGVPVLGKPDLTVQHRLPSGEEVKVVLDWKVNGYETSASAKSGYVECDGKVSPAAMLIKYGETFVDGNRTLERVAQDWATQIYIYGGDNLVGIDQIFRSGKGDLRCAKHRLTLSERFKTAVHGRLKRAWEVINSDHFFRDMTKEESRIRCDMLQHRTTLRRIDFREALPDFPGTE